LGILVLEYTNCTKRSNRKALEKGFSQSMKKETISRNGFLCFYLETIREELF
jgi:hypothetical protein